MTAPTGISGPQTLTGPRSGWTEWVYLAYLSILIFQPAGSPDTRTVDWLVVVIVVALFVPIYAAGVLRPDSQRWLIVPTVVLGIAAVPFNSGATVLFVYAAAFAAETQSRRATIRWLVVLTGLIVALALVSAVPMPWRLFSFLPAGIFVWVIGVTVLEDAEERRVARGLRVENARIEHLATVAERERIARDLHDLLGHSLTSVVVRAQLVRRLAAGDPQRAAAEAASIESIAREALGEVRAAVGGWRELSLTAELESARAALDAAGVALEVELEPDLAIVPSAERALALALREAVTNVVRHAGARTCKVTIGARDGDLRLAVSDDGAATTAADDGHGLTGMRERIAALGGAVQRASAGGTTITVTLPLRVVT